MDNEIEQTLKGIREIQETDFLKICNGEYVSARRCMTLIDRIRYNPNNWDVLKAQKDINVIQKYLDDRENDVEYWNRSEDDLNKYLHYSDLSKHERTLSDMQEGGKVPIKKCFNALSFYENNAWEKENPKDKIWIIKQYMDINYPVRGI